MDEQFSRNPFMDYRNFVPFARLSGFIVKHTPVSEKKPAMSLQECLMRKKTSCMINYRRLQYRKRCEDYRNGRN